MGGGGREGGREEEKRERERERGLRMVEWRESSQGRERFRKGGTEKEGRKE